MSIEKRRFIRFSLDIPAFRHKSNREVIKIFIRQISVGGCLIEWDENLSIGDHFRLELELPNKNRLPLLCKTLYRFQGKGIGVKFLNVSQFEQELLGQTISQSLEDDGLPLLVDPFAIPPTYIAHNKLEEDFYFLKKRDEEIADEILAQDN
jgi:hypothetical protein